LIQIAITEQNIKLPNKVILIFRDTSASKSRDFDQLHTLYLTDNKLQVSLFNTKKYVKISLVQYLSFDGFIVYQFTQETKL